MLPSSPSNNTLSSYTAQYHQQYESDVDKDPSVLTSAPSPASPGRVTSGTLTAIHPYSSPMPIQPNGQYQNNINNNSSSSAGYLSPLSAQHSTVPQIRSPLAMSFSGQVNTGGAAFNTRSSYNNRVRGRRDSLQQSSVPFSPTLSHSSPSASSQMSLHPGSNNLYSHQSRLGYLWPGAGSASAAVGNNRNRCLSTSSVDSNTSSVGLSHLTPALAAMSVQHHQQGSPASSPYQSYSSSPQQSGLQHHYQQQQQQQQQQASSESSYPYHSPFSSPLPPSQVPAYDPLSMTAANIASNIYGSTPPVHSSTDIMYHSSSSYGVASSAPNYTSSARYGYSSVLPLAPSLYSEQDGARMSQSHFESSSPLSGPEPSGTHPFDYSDQYQQPQAQYYGHQAQQGLGILVSGGMARNMSSSPENDDDDDGHQQHQEQQQSSMKRSTSATGILQTADDIHAVIGKDGKTLVYICPKCDPSKVVEFTTKSNLKRHLENKNIHNTPYERRRDQKRWQGHEKKQVSRDETTLRMRKWRNCNPEKNRFNDMRCRVYRNARKIYGDSYSEAKEEYIRTEIERRKQNMIIRNSRRAEWANQATNNGSSIGESSPSPSSSPISAASTGGLGFQMPEVAFMFTSPYSATSSLVSDQQIPAYGSTDDASPSQDSSKSEKQKPDESKFLQDLKENRLPPRRRSRSAMHTPATGASENSYSASTPIVSTSSATFGSRGESPFGCLTSYGDSLTADTFEYGESSLQQQTIRRRKQRSATDNADILRHGNSFANMSAFGGGSSVADGGSYQGGFMDSNQQLQILEQKYNSGSITQGLLIGKSGIQQHQNQDQESLESVVEAMEINQAMGLATNVGSTTVAPTAHAGGLYGDRDASAWLTPSATYNAHSLAGSTQPEDGSRGFPFPVIRDRKELARAAGIRLDIPSQHHLGPHHWNLNGIGGTGSVAPADDMVGGSATSLESSAVSHQEYSPLSNSPLSAGALRERNEGQGNRDEDESVPDSSHRRYSHTDGAAGMTKLKGSNFEVFGIPLYCQTLSSAESGFFASVATPMTETNYLVKDQGVARRYSTAMANLSSL